VKKLRFATWIGPKDYRVLCGVCACTHTHHMLGWTARRTVHTQTPQVQNYAAKHRPSTRKISVNHHE